MRRVCALLLMGVLACAAKAQNASGSSLTFTLDRGGATPPRYSIEVDEETGHGFYRTKAPAQAQATQPAKPVEIPIVVQPATLKKLFAAVPLVKSDRCDAHNKNIAQTGVKTLRYKVDSAVFECTYNYALDDRVNNATALFEALAETMQYGDRLSAKLRFDRLGLDAEIDDLDDALKDGRALEVANIAPVLEAIQNDDRVMDRVRRKATRLLEMASQRTEEKDSSER